MSHRGTRQDEQTGNQSPEAKDLQGDEEETNGCENSGHWLLERIFDKCSHIWTWNFFSCLSMAKAVLLSLKDHTLEKVPARMSAIQGPISYEPTIVRQATSPIQDIACCQIPLTQINRLSMNSVLEYLPAGEGLLPKWIFFVRLQRVNNGSTLFLTMFRSRSYRSVTAFKPTCPSVPHKRCIVVLNQSPLAYLPTPSPAHHPSHLCQLAPSVPGPQSLLSSVYMPPTTSQPSPCTSWLSGHTLSHSHISCPSG